MSTWPLPLWLCTFISFTLTVCPLPATAQNPLPTGTTYYIAPDGSDNNPGTLDQPLASLNEAMNLVEPGDTVLFRGGYYVLKRTVWIDAQGTPDAYITIRPYEDEHVVLDCINTQYDTSCLGVGGQYLTIENLEIVYAKRSGIGVWGGAHLRIRNNTIHHSVKGGIYVGYEVYEPLTVVDILIEGNEIYRTCQINNPVPPGDGSGWPSAIGVGQATLVTVTNNLVYENYGEGIIFGLMDGGVATHNKLYDNYSVQMYIDNGSRIVYQGNVMTTTRNTEFFRYGETANGIQLANEWGQGSNPLEHNRVLNNIVVGARHGFYYGSYERGGGMQNVLVANNTFYDSPVAMVNIDDDNHHNTEFVNNIFYQLGRREQIIFEGDENIWFHHNNWYGGNGNTGNGGGSGDRTTNPLLVNSGGMDAADYALTAFSPLINTGSEVNGLSSDYAGNPRPYGDAYDMGAYEFQGEPQTTPFTPTSVLYFQFVVSQ